MWNSRDNLWYAAGLAFECAGCGTCCAGPAEGYVWVTKREIAAIAAHLGLDETQIQRRYVRKVRRRLSLTERAGTNDCVFLETGADGVRSCRIYPVRPTQCRTWPFWAGNLRTLEEWALAGVRCPGVNRGPIFTLDEILERRDAIRE